MTLKATIAHTIDYLLSTEHAFEEACANSYCDYHAKGFDYFCLDRNVLGKTLKLYFASENGRQLVHPHDHRYDFNTLCLSGALMEARFERGLVQGADRTYHEFTFDTPLLKGDGFEYAGLAHLNCVSTIIHRKGSRWTNKAEETHTLTIGMPDTVLALVQYPDKVNVGVPTSTYLPALRDEEPPPPPSLTGLYNEMKPDRARELLHIAAELVKE